MTVQMNASRRIITAITALGSITKLQQHVFQTKLLARFSPLGFHIVTEPAANDRAISETT